MILKMFGLRIFMLYLWVVLMSCCLIFLFFLLSLLKFEFMIGRILMFFWLYFLMICGMNLVGIMMMVILILLGILRMFLQIGNFFLLILILLFLMLMVYIFFFVFVIDEVFYNCVFYFFRFFRSVYNCYVFGFEQCFYFGVSYFYYF